ncbi:YabP/YqfC family sporulation protein [Caldicellulosiruptoraceae bacterium PP1]
MKKEKRNKIEKVIDKTGLPKEIIENKTKLILIGDDELTIENHKGVMKFEEDSIEINAKPKPIKIVGHSFSIEKIDDEVIFIKGKVKSIDYSY